MGASYGDHVRGASGLTLGGGDLGDHRFAVSVRFDDAHVGAQDPVEQQVAVRRGDGLVLPALQDEDRIHAQPPGTGGGHPRPVGLHSRPGDHGVAVLGDGVGEDEVELARLVAPEGESGLVVALDEETRSAEFGGEGRHLLEGGREVGEGGLLEAGDGFVEDGHGVGGVSFRVACAGAAAGGEGGDGECDAGDECERAERGHGRSSRAGEFMHGGAGGRRLKARKRVPAMSTVHLGRADARSPSRMGACADAWPEGTLPGPDDGADPDRIIG